MSTAMNIFLRYSVRYGGIPFDLRIEKPNAETLSAIDDVNNNRNMSKTFDSVSALQDHTVTCFDKQIRNKSLEIYRWFSFAISRLL